MIQFLVESIVLASLGGIIGIILGLAASYLGCVLMKLSFSPSPMIAFIAFVFSGWSAWCSGSSQHTRPRDLIRSRPCAMSNYEARQNAEIASLENSCAYLTLTCDFV